MSDAETVLAALERVNRRVRLKRLLRSLAIGLPAIFVPVLGFAIGRRFTELRFGTVFLGLWIATSIGWMLVAVLKRGRLAQAATLADARGDLKDELTTAYWFICEKSDSPWVALQVHRAARTAGGLDPRALVPTVVPRGSLLATAALAILTAFFWAWPERTSSAPETSAAVAEWLEKAPALDEARARELGKTLAAVEEGKLSLAEGLAALDEMQNLLEEGNLDAQKLREGLDEMADALKGSETLDALAKALRDRRLDEAAELLRKLAQNAKELERAREGLERAAETGSVPLEALLESLKKALEALEAKDRTEADRAMREAQRNLAEMGEKLEAQDRLNAASRQLEDLRQALARDMKLDPTQAGLQMGNQKRSGPAIEGGAVTLPGEAADGERKGEDKDSLDGSSSGLAAGRSQSGADAPGEPTRLDVELAMEKIEAPEKPRDPEKDEISKEKSREEHSALEYQDVSERSGYAGEDALHAESVPWEYRTRVKSYFLTLQPRAEKQKH